MTEAKVGTPPTIQLIESDLEGVYLIPQAALVADIKNRSKLSNRELRILIQDVKNVGEAARPYVDSVVEYVKDFVEDIQSDKKTTD